jgi:hypothetical protein
MGKVENTEKTIPGHRYMMDEMCQTKIRSFFVQAGTERRREDANYENFYYAFLYDNLKENKHLREKTTILNRLEAHIVRLHSKRVHFIKM